MSKIKTPLVILSLVLLLNIINSKYEFLNLPKLPEVYILPMLLLFFGISLFVIFWNKRKGKL